MRVRVDGGPQEPTVVQVSTGLPGDRGPQGLSAYELAVIDGFEGTEEEWLASLAGASGDDGADGTDGEAGPKGDKGDKGDTGPTGGTTIASYYDVTAAPYSATGNGSTNDAAAIQAALDDAHTAGGGTVVLPAGRTFAVGTYLVPRAGVTVNAYGATIRATSVGLLRNFLTSDTFPVYTGEGRIQILGGTWDANSIDGTGGGAVSGLVNALTFGHAKGITVRDATIKNVSGAHGIEINSCTDVRIVNCRFEGFRDNTSDHSRAFSEAIQLDYALADSGSIGPADNTPCKGVLVQGCSFGASDRLPGFGRAVGSHTSVSATVWHENIQVLGNRVEATAQEGVRAYAWKNAVIADNIISGTGAPCVIVTGPDPAVVGYANICQQISIRGNTCTGPASGSSSTLRIVGFATARPAGVKISGNTVSGSPSTGIYVTQAAAPSITDNLVTACTTSSVYAITCTAPSIIGNVAQNSGGVSIGVDACTGGHVGGNVVDTTTTGHGILVNGGTDVTVTGNRVIAAKASGIRATTSAARCHITGNTIIRAGQTALGIDITASVTGGVVVGNDLTGGSWPTGTALSLLGAAPLITDWAGGTTAPGHNLVS